MRVVIFGAGNIGRSFIGRKFSQGGWEVVFVDVDSVLVEKLNQRKSYPVVIKEESSPDLTVLIGNVRAVNGKDSEAVVREIMEADVLASSVGKAALPRLLPNLATGLLARRDRQRPIDLILAENDREAVETVSEGLKALLPAEFPLSSTLGLVETSIGKMVPVMRAEDLARDRLLVFSEAYDTLIVDRKGFLGSVPALPGLLAVDRILAWVDRKLFVHNLGHAAVAYFGFLADPAEPLLYKALALPGVREKARAAMSQAADALAIEYPGEMRHGDLEAHIDDLLSRFANSALGDTVNRVGRDLSRKLHRSDRVVGAALLCQRHSLPSDAIVAVLHAAVQFAATDEQGQVLPSDSAFRSLMVAKGLPQVLSEVCNLSETESRMFLEDTYRGGL